MTYPAAVVEASDQARSISVPETAAAVRSVGALGAGVNVQPRTRWTATAPPVDPVNPT